MTDGTTAHVRAITPDDAPAIVALYTRLSRETLVLRYFGPHPQLSESEIEELTHPDGIDVVVLVAELHDMIVGVAQYHREPGKDEAEVAFLVDDSFQGHGIGTMLLEHLASEGRGPRHTPVRGGYPGREPQDVTFLADAGFVASYQRDAEVMRVVLDIESTREARAAAERATIPL